MRKTKVLDGLCGLHNSLLKGSLNNNITVSFDVPLDSIPLNSL